MAPEHPNVSPLPDRGDDTSSLGERPSLRNPDGLLRRLLIIFCVLGLIAVGVHVKFFIDVSADIQSYVTDVPAQVAGSSAAAGGTGITALQTVKNQMAILLGITVVCFGAVLYLFVRRVVVPLNVLAQTAKDISKGNLSVSARKNPHNDVGELGEVLNDVAANLQEVLLLTGTTVGNSFSAVEKIQEALAAPGGATEDELQEQLHVLRQDLELLSSLVQEFDFYQTRFDGRKVVPDHTGRER